MKPAALRTWIWIREELRVAFVVVEAPWKIRRGRCESKGSVVW